MRIDTGKHFSGKEDNWKDVFLIKNVYNAMKNTCG